MSFDNFNPSAAYTVTRIEDVLDPKIYKKVIESVIEEYKKDYGDIAFDEYELNEDSMFTNLKGDSHFIFCKTNQANKNKNEFISFIESKKHFYPSNM